MLEIIGILTVLYLLFKLLPDFLWFFIKFTISFALLAFGVAFYYGLIL